MHHQCIVTWNTVNESNGENRMLDGLAITLWCGAVALDCEVAGCIGLAVYVTLKWLGAL